MDGRIIVSIVFLVIFVLIIILGIRESATYKAKVLERVKKEYGKKRKSIDRSLKLLSHHRIKLSKGYYLDKITMRDMDIQNIFSCINHTRSSIGQEYLLYQMMRGRLLEEELNEFDGLVSFFSDNDDVRYSLLAEYEKLGKNSKIDIDKYFEKNKNNKKASYLPHIICYLLYIVAIGLLLTKTGAGIIALVIAISLGVLQYFKAKTNMAGFLDSAFYLIRLIEASRTIGAKAGGASYESLDNLSESILKIDARLKGALRGYGYVSLSSAENKNVLSSIVLYINMLLHIDILMFYGIDKRLSKCEDDIRELYDYLGKIEAALAVDSFRKSLNIWCRAEFIEEDSHSEYCIKDVYHPLVEKPVLNDVDASKSLLITGANASGKSTFLRAVGLSVIMAQTINTVCARSYKMPYMRVYSSMAIADSVQDGDSFFMAEVKSLKRIIDASNTEGDRVICFVDEILKGTNTIERIAASSEVTRHLIDHNVLCIFASHDIELCTLLQDYLNNVHFEEADCQDKDDVYFTYKLMKGPSTGKNAIKLLGRLGVEAGLVDKAGIMAKRFEETKEWVLE